MMDIMLIEDNHADADLFRLSMRATSHAGRVLWFEEGRSALDYLFERGEHAGRDVPGLIVLDLNMPEMDGREVLRQLKHDDQLCQIPIVVMSSSEDDRDVRSCYRMHANSYVRKPLDYSSLKEIAVSLERFWMKTAVLPS
ncbi:MAG: response regulator [Myxococcota bacterium]